MRANKPVGAWFPIACVCMALLLCLGSVGLRAYADDITDEEVLAVIAQLEAIDTLQQMQDKRAEYTVSTRYDVGETDTAIIEEHEAARNGYETYVSEMTAARLAARQAYDGLTDGQRAQIDAELAARLDDELSTVLHTTTAALTPGEGAYTFEAVEGAMGYAYEVSNHMVSGNIPQTFILVDTADGAQSWTPNGLYVYGESNYEVTYCCDVETPLNYGTHYRRINLEDSDYYSRDSARHIRAILQNSYPYLTVEEMKAALLADGLSADFVDSLTRGDMIAAVQMAVWTYANASGAAADGLGYFSSVDVTRNIGIYFTPYHDYTNECWEWFPNRRMRSYDPRAEYRVNVLAYHLYTLPGVDADEEQIVISDVEVTRAELIPNSDGSYLVGMYVTLNSAGHAGDELTVTAIAGHTGEDGVEVITGRTGQLVAGSAVLELYVKAKPGDTVRVAVEGTQYLERGVYFYEPEGGRDVSQSLVGVAEGETRVWAEKAFLFEGDVGDSGIRIYKTESGTGKPLSGIVFRVYALPEGAEVALDQPPTEEELALYAVEENLRGTVTTDVTGYAGLTLEEGIYLVIEEDDPEKIVAPVSPFYLHLPMTETVEEEDGTVTVELIPVVSVYPKNETIPPSDDPPPPPPPPDQVTGRLGIVKYDEDDSSILLEGAAFRVYRAATEDDTETEILRIDGVSYAVVPVTVDGEELVLTTDEQGSALSPELSCGLYYLVEIQAPAGYNLTGEVVQVTVNSSVLTTVTTVEIPNSRGSLLPETGGIGTGLFTASGTLLVLLAFTLLALRRRKGE